MQNAAIRMAVESGVLEAIGANKGKRITSQELSKKTRYDALLISKLIYASLAKVITVGSVRLRRGLKN